MNALVAAAIILFPPAQYDHAFEGEVIVLYDAAQVCKHKNDLGCAVVGNGYGKCIVHLRRNLTRHDKALVMRHEIAHCNGWGEDHAGS